MTPNPVHVVAKTLKEMYPQNPDIVLGREARRIVDALRSAGIMLLMPMDPANCYECGEVVEPDEGEQHGRAGMVHYACIP